jgi:hypothetical protein
VGNVNVNKVPKSAVAKPCTPELTCRDSREPLPRQSGQVRSGQARPFACELSMCQARYLSFLPFGGKWSEAKITLACRRLLSSLALGCVLPIHSPVVLHTLRSPVAGPNNSLLFHMSFSACVTTLPFLRLSGAAAGCQGVPLRAGQQTPTRICSHLHATHHEGQLRVVCVWGGGGRGMDHHHHRRLCT